MIIKVFGIGNHSTGFDSKQPPMMGIINRAYCSSGTSKKSKSWGNGFISFSPGIKLYSAPESGETIKASKLTKTISPLVKGLEFEGEFRTTESQQEFLAIFRRSIEEPTHYLITVKSKIREGDGQTEIERLLPDSQGKIVSKAESISKSGSTHSYEAVVLFEKGQIVRTNKATYQVVDQKLVRTGVAKSNE
ncbi:hypothetical protein SP15_141 [Bacillus phage SP-15]|uniref:Uncharacterized protein n=1 Tax=Bacillus phage SP-15 TaxID=1792032 RepID=A0A127AW71_9CAUD|nr:hypothetical protein SP15_141 [Bacillus phage SP-15]AMM44939.1 hypothetical protein SP15_141 [Bacillus phage SP-15]